MEVFYQIRNGDATGGFGQKLFGRPLSKSDYVSLTGALPGSRIKVQMNGARLELSVEHPLYQAHRVVFRDSNGVLTMKNESIMLNHTQRGRGIGTRVFARQVDGLAKLGVQSIKAQAYRADDSDPSSSFNGHYTWARLGYNATLRVRDKRKLLGSRNPALVALGRRNIVTLHELFDTPGGPEHWREHGDTIDVRFDPTPGSSHRDRLDQYLYDKGINPYAD